MLNVAVAKPLLNSSRIVPIVGQLKAAGMMQHVRVDVSVGREAAKLAKPDRTRYTCAVQHDRGSGDRAAERSTPSGIDLSALGATPGLERTGRPSRLPDASLILSPGLRPGASCRRG